MHTTSSEEQRQAVEARRNQQRLTQYLARAAELTGRPAIIPGADAEHGAYVDFYLPGSPQAVRMSADDARLFTSQVVIACNTAESKARRARRRLAA